MLKKLQAITGVIFAGFLALHLINTWLAVTGPDTYDAVQGLLRSVYQFIAVEALLLAALSVHVAVGITRLVQEPPRQLSLRARLHRYAGFFLAVVIVGHILAVRGPSWFFGVYPGFEGLAFSLEFLPGYFYPYYFLLGLAGFYHGLNGLSVAAGRLGRRVVVSRGVLVTTTGMAAVLMLSALLGLGGQLFDVGEPSNGAFADLARDLLGVEPSS